MRVAKDPVRAGSFACPAKPSAKQGYLSFFPIVELPPLSESSPYFFQAVHYKLRASRHFESLGDMVSMHQYSSQEYFLLLETLWGNQHALQLLCMTKFFHEGSFELRGVRIVENESPYYSSIPETPSS